MLNNAEALKILDNLCSNTVPVLSVERRTIEALREYVKAEQTWQLSCRKISEELKAAATRLPDEATLEKDLEKCEEERERLLADNERLSRENTRLQIIEQKQSADIGEQFMQLVEAEEELNRLRKLAHAAIDQRDE